MNYSGSHIKQNITCAIAAIILLFCFPLLGRADFTSTVPLGPQARISLLTSSPSDDEVYTLYGHTAIRVVDPDAKRDVVFNYGIFDFSRPGFIFRFVRGETDYMLRAYPFSVYILDYMERGCEIVEQTLNLRPDNREALWQALVENERPENRVYRYNFFFDNCATRPAEMIERCITGEIIYDPTGQLRTFRDVINECTQHTPWLTLGCDLALGLPTDMMMTYRETFFLPHLLKEAYAKTTVVYDEKQEPLVAETSVLLEAAPKSAPKDNATTPLAIAWMLFAAALGVTVREVIRQTVASSGRVFDAIFFPAAGIAGCVLFFISFISVHPCVFPNFSTLWLHPFHLVGVAFWALKKRRYYDYYHIANIVAVLAAPVVMIVVGQHFNAAFAPLMLALLMRSYMQLRRDKFFKFL